MTTRIHSTLALALSLALTPALLAQTTAVTSTTTGGGTTSTETSTTTTAGTVTEIGADGLMIRTTTSPDPLRYSFSKTTTYVDETGAPVSIDLVKSGLPVTVQYIREGDRMIANRVVVRRSTTTTTDASPTVIERNTNTTITKPPMVVEKPVYVDRVVEKPVIVEKKVAVPVEKKSTSTARSSWRKRSLHPRP